MNFMAGICQEYSFSFLPVVSRYNNNNNTRHLDAPFTKVQRRLQRVQKIHLKATKSI